MSINRPTYKWSGVSWFGMDPQASWSADSNNPYIQCKVFWLWKFDFRLQFQSSQYTKNFTCCTTAQILLILSIMHQLSVSVFQILTKRCLLAVAYLTCLSVWKPFFHQPLMGLRNSSPTCRIMLPALLAELTLLESTQTTTMASSYLWQVLSSAILD